MPLPSRSTLFDMMREQAAATPAAVAVIDDGRAIGFAALATAARRIAGGLRARGIGRGDRVGILIGNRVEWLESCFGIAALGAVTVPLSTWSKEAELDYLLADSGVAALIAADRVAAQDFAAMLAVLVPEAAAAMPGEWRSARYPALRTIVMLGDAMQPGWTRYADLAAAAPLAGSGAATPDDDGLILYTSGSSARPKAVRLAQRGIVENGFNIGARMKLTAADRVLLAPPLFWAYGATNAVPATLSHGAALVLQPRFDPGGWLALIERHRCTAVYTLPSMTGAALRHPDFRPERTRSLRTGLMIGSPEEVRLAAVELGAAQICNIYGSTETYGNCCVTLCDTPLDQRMAGQGQPLPGVTLRIADPETGAALPAETVGAVEVHGYITPGYCGASTVNNAAAFTADGFFRTGDLGRLDPDGVFHFAARDNDMIKKAGINVAPAEVESVLLQHPAVAQAAVVGAPDRERGEAIVAFVVAAPGAHAEAAVLTAHCRALASSYKVPDRIEIRTALPTTETGKLFRRGLKEEAARLLAAAP